MLDDVKKEALKRLNYASGHLEGIRRMIEEERYCVDVLQQTYAVRQAIKRIEATVLDGHLRTHVVEGVRNGQEQEVLDELSELYAMQDR
jgi:DNA-binding FrmR family transcriptional regulator